MENPEVAQVFEEVADLLEIQGANPFRVRAYRNAVRTIRDLSQSLAEYCRDRRCRTIPRASGRALRGLAYTLEQLDRPVVDP